VAGSLVLFETCSASHHGEDDAQAVLLHQRLGVAVTGSVGLLLTELFLLAREIKGENTAGEALR
jgi:hypothetical protein